MDPTQNSAGPSNKDTAGSAGAAGAAGEKDYGDKVFDMLAKKTGHQVDRNTSEKITDGVRTLFEKATGKKVDPKISN